MTTYLRFAIPVLVVLSMLAPARAQPPSPLGNQFRVNTYTLNRQMVPDVAVNEAGDFVVVWNSDHENALQYNIRGQRFDASGNSRGGEFLVNAPTTNSQRWPAVVSGSEGDFIVTWTSGICTTCLDTYDVLAQRFDGVGNRIGDEFQVNSFSSGGQWRSEIASTPDGAFVIVWLGEQGGRHVFGQRYDKDGDPIGTEFQISTTPIRTSYGSFFDPAVAARSDGSFVVVWEGLDGAYQGIFGQRFDNAGVPLGGEFRVNTTTSYYEWSPSVAMDADGNFVVAWSSVERGNFSRPGILAQRYDASGDPLGGELVVETTTPTYSLRPAVASDAVGNFVVVWETDVGSSFEVVGRSFDAGGNPLSGEFRVNSVVAGSQGMSRMASDPEGDFVVSWVGPDGSSYGIFGQRFAGPGLHLEADGSCPGTVTVSLVNAPPVTEVAVVAAANTNGFVKGPVLCQGTELEIGEPFQLPPVFVIVDGEGRGSAQLELGADRCHLQALALATCDTSNVVLVPSLGD